MKIRNIIKKLKQGKIYIGGRYWCIGYSKSDGKFILEQQTAVDEEFSTEITAKEVRQQKDFKIYKR